jgi:transposase-like protein
VNYTEGFKARMIERLAGPDAISAAALHKEVGVAQCTLSKWLRDASTLSSMGSKKNERRGGARGSRDRSGVEKLRIVAEAEALPQAELGEFLRRNGIHEVDLNAWRKVAAEALGGSPKTAKDSAAAARRIKQLEGDLAKKNKRVRAVEALLDLQKKVREIWGDADEPTQPRSES